jgi:hypothetical protein
MNPLKQGYCGVCFTPCQTFKNVPGFLLTKSAENATSATNGSNCPDQLIIPGGSNGGSVRESVYCGAALNQNTTSDAPICSECIEHILNNATIIKKDFNQIFVYYSFIWPNYLHHRCKRRQRRNQQCGVLFDLHSEEVLKIKNHSLVFFFLLFHSVI